MSSSYPTDLPDAQWELIQPLLPAPKSGGRPRSTDLRAVFNALLYILTEGIAGATVAPRLSQVEDFWMALLVSSFESRL